MLGQLTAKRFCAFGVFLIFIFQTIALSAQIPGASGISAVSDMKSALPFIPASVPLIKGIKVFPDNPLRLDFIIDEGDHFLDDKEFKAQADTLIKYFLASLTVPDEDIWVNLNPAERNRVIPDAFGVTAMGRDMLEQDYELKKLTAQLMNPNGDLGREFWEKIYQDVTRRYGAAEVPVAMLNKVWIVPGKAVVWEGRETGMVVEAGLKVMLEEGISTQLSVLSKNDQPLNTYNLQRTTFKDVLLPTIEHEVNFGKTFAPLRQIYHSLILAAWFKRRLRESLLARVYVGKNKVLGVDIKDKDAKEKIYLRYLEAFQKGAATIKEEYDPLTQQIIPRKYVTGGTQFQSVNNILEIIFGPSVVQNTSMDHAMLVSAGLEVKTSDRAILSGGLKNIGLPLDKNIEEEIKNKEERWRALAKAPPRHA